MKNRLQFTHPKANIKSIYEHGVQVLHYELIKAIMTSGASGVEKAEETCIHIYSENGEL
jgi:hypothetical protein